MSSKTGGILTTILGLAILGSAIFVAVITGGVALPALVPWFATALALIQGGISVTKSLEYTGAIDRTKPTADEGALGTFIFGTTVVPMNLVFEEITGSSPDRVLHDVYAHAWHRIEGYVSMIVGTDTGPEAVSFSGNAATGAYSNLLWWFRADGTQSAALSGTPFDSNNWPSTAIFSGVTHSGLVWNIDDDAFRAKFSSVPSSVEIEVQGAWLYDPRLDGTYGTGSQDYGTPSTWSFNNGNAALVLLRGLIGEYSGSDLVWGRGAAETAIDMASFITAANVADEALDSDIRYRLGGMWQISGSFEEFVKQWESETGGKLSKSGGQYHVWLPNDDLTPLTTITETNIVQGAAIQHTIAGGLEGLFNTARGRYIDAANGYVGKPYAEIGEASAVTEDNGKRVLSQDFSWVQSEAIAQRVARIRVRRSRFQRVWIVPLGWAGQSPNYAVFSVHTLNCKETNYSNQLVRVIDRKMSYMGLTVLTLQQEDASIYDETVALNDPLAGNNVTSKSSIFGTIAATGSPGADGIGSWTPVLTNVSLNGNTFTKTDGAGYTAQVYSAEKFASLTVTTSGPTTTNLGVFYGLNIDPTTDASYTSIDYCFAYQDNGHLTIYESGSLIADLGTYSASEATSIVYTGHMVKYFRGATNVRVVGNYGKQFALDTSFHGAGVVLPNLTVTPGGPLPPDGRKWIAAADGKPAGWRGVEGVADRARLSFDSAGRVSISGAGNTAFGLPAIPVSAAQTYTLRVRHISSGASATGLYIRANEKASALVAGTTHVGSPAAIAEAVVDVRTGYTEIAPANGPMPGTTITEALYSYTPTAGTLFMSLSFYNWGTTGVAYAVEDVSLVRLGSSTNLLETTESVDVALGWTPVQSQGMLRSGKTFTKVAPGAANTWDTAFSSAEKYGACQITGQPANATDHIMFGLNSDPTTSDSFASVDFALYAAAGGVAVYENGSNPYSSGTYAAGDVFSVQCDGVKVRYLHNGVVFYTSSNTPAKALYADSSFYELGAILNNVDFGPIAAGLIDLTNQTQGVLAVGQHNIAARGWNNTTAFSVTDSDTIAWAAGTFTSADGSSYSIAGGNTGNMSARTYIYLDIGVSTTAFQTTTTAANAVGSGKVMVASAINGTTEARYMVFGGAGGQNIDAADIVAGTVVAANIAAGTITANEIASSLTWTNELILSSTGKIRKAKTSASDTTKGIWLGDDGASGDDFHVGDSSTYLWFDYSAATLKFRGNLDFAASTFTPTWGSGFSSDPTGDFNYIDFGSFVMLWFSDAISGAPGTSNGTLMSITNLPSGIRPANIAVAPTTVLNNGDENPGYCIIGTTGTVSFFVWKLSGSFMIGGTNFTTSGSKSPELGGIILYPK